MIPAEGISRPHQFFASFIKSHLVGLSTNRCFQHSSRKSSTSSICSTNILLYRNQSSADKSIVAFTCASISVVSTCRCTPNVQILEKPLRVHTVNGCPLHGRYYCVRRPDLVGFESICQVDRLLQSTSSLPSGGLASTFVIGGLSFL